MVDTKALKQQAKRIWDESNNLGTGNDKGQRSWYRRKQIKAAPKEHQYHLREYMRQITTKARRESSLTVYQKFIINGDRQ